MVIYYINLVSIFTWYILFSSFMKKEKAKEKTINIVLLQMILIAGLRGMTVGTDTKNYYNIFCTLQHIKWKDLRSFYVEPGYVVLNKLVDMFFGKYQILLFLVAVVVYIGLFAMIKKMSLDPLMSVFLFITIGYFASSMNIFRQYIATVCVWVSFYTYVWKKKKLQTYIWIFIGFLFHDSILVIVPVLIFWKFMNNKSSFRRMLIEFVFGIGCVGSIVYINQIVDIVVKLNLKSESLLTEDVTSSSFFSYAIKIAVIIFYVICLQIDKSLHENEQLGFLCYLSIISLVINIISIKFSLLGRFNLLFALPMIVFIPNLIVSTNFEPRQRFLVKMIIYTAFIGAYMYTLPDTDIVPWVGYWQ